MNKKDADIQRLFYWDYFFTILFIHTS